MTQPSNNKRPRRALIVIDVQNEYVDGALPIEYPPVAGSLQCIAAAIDAAHAADLPVIVVQHDAGAAAPIFAVGSSGWQLHEVVGSRRYDHLIHKTEASAFAGTDLQDWLATRDIDTLAVVGYMTHNCDAATIVQAAQLGLKVEFLADASGALPYENAAGRASAEEIHRVYSVVFHTGFAAVQSTEAWIAAVRAARASEADNVFASNQRARHTR